jgi:LmbE family N-acetylglucosaminyl deacetylase
MLDLTEKKLLIISPHPDDEVLGCGGLISKIKARGGKVYVLFLTVGDTDDYRKEGLSTGSERMREIENVAKFLKYDDFRIAFSGNQYHLRLDQIAQLDLMKELENGPLSLNKIKPDIVATPYFSDYNQDHRAATMALFGATRPTPDDQKPLQKVILGYESVPTAGWWDSNKQNMNYYLHLTKKELEDKMKGLELYTSQVREGNHPRALASIKKLAAMRGIESGVDAAEAFFTYRIIQ